MKSILPLLLLSLYTATTTLACKDRYGIAYIQQNISRAPGIKCQRHEAVVLDKRCVAVRCLPNRFVIQTENDGNCTFTPRSTVCIKDTVECIEDREYPYWKSDGTIATCRPF